MRRRQKARTPIELVDHKRVHAVYVMRTLVAGPRHDRVDYYIGYTVNPERRELQHRGLVSGHRALRTERWNDSNAKMIMCVLGGFMNARDAQKFEHHMTYRYEVGRSRSRPRKVRRKIDDVVRWVLQVLSPDADPKTRWGSTALPVGHSARESLPAFRLFIMNGDMMRYTVGEQVMSNVKVDAEMSDVMNYRAVLLRD